MTRKYSTKTTPITDEKHQKLIDRAKKTGIKIFYQVDQALENYFKSNGGNDEEK